MNESKVDLHTHAHYPLLVIAYSLTSFVAFLSYLRVLPNLSRLFRLLFHAASISKGSRSIFSLPRARLETSFIIVLVVCLSRV